MILGIDPGLKGGLALYFPELSHLYDMPLKDGAVDAHTIYNMVRALSTLEFAAIEKVHSRPRQSGVFNFGVSYGKVIAVLETLQIPIVYVSPAKWKVAMGLRGLDKAASVELAVRLMPQCKPQLYGPRGGPLDGRAEALLIALYASTLK